MMEELSLLESKEIQTVDIPESPLKKFESLTFDTKKLGEIGILVLPWEVLPMRQSNIQAY
jgi:hypothetical protein